MTREEAENLIAEKVRQIIEICTEYNPKTDYMELCFFKSRNRMQFNNEYWDHDIAFPICYVHCIAEEEVK